MLIIGNLDNLFVFEEPAICLGNFITKGKSRFMSRLIVNENILDNYCDD